MSGAGCRWLAGWLRLIGSHQQMLCLLAPTRSDSLPACNTDSIVLLPCLACRAFGDEMAVHICDDSSPTTCAVLGLLQKASGGSPPGALKALIHHRRHGTRTLSSPLQYVCRNCPTHPGLHLQATGGALNSRRIAGDANACLMCALHVAWAVGKSSQASGSGGTHCDLSAGAMFAKQLQWRALLRFACSCANCSAPHSTLVDSLSPVQAIAACENYAYGRGKVRQW